MNKTPEDPRVGPPVEIVGEDGRPAAPGELGRVLVTTLHNRMMPLIRYEIGDYAFAAENEMPMRPNTAPHRRDRRPRHQPLHR